MADYIATFFTHFGAVRFSRDLKARGMACKLMPVPRKVSSSCGSCVSFSAASDEAFRTEDVEHIFRAGDGTFQEVFSNL